MSVLVIMGWWCLCIACAFAGYERGFRKGQLHTCPTPLIWSLLTPDDPQYARSLTGEVLGVRLLPDGRREYLCMNKALDPQRYSVMEESR